MNRMRVFPALHHWQVISAEEILQIREAAFHVLSNTGFQYHNHEILTRLQKRGFKVDFNSRTVYPQPDQLEWVEEAARKNAPQVVDEPLLRRVVPSGASVGHNFTCYYDATEGVRRSAALQDIRNVVKAWHMIPEINQTGPCMTAQDVDYPIEPIVSAVEVMKLTHKIKNCPEMMIASQLPYLEELETIMTGDQVRYHVNGCSVNHFTMDERACECLIAVAKNGLEGWWINSTPIAGANAPVTLAGATVVGAAEILGGWLAGWIMNEDAWLSAIPLAGMMDMRTARSLFSTPESILIDSALYQFFYHLYGIQIGLCVGYTDATIPGMQAVNDKMLKSLAYGLFIDTLGGQTGTLSAGNIYSPTQQIIDLELNRQTAQLAGGFNVTPATLAVEEIEGFVRHDFQSFLMRDHTAHHWHEVLWMPKMMNRLSLATAEEELKNDAAIVQRAEDRWRGALAAYSPESVDPHKVKAAEEVLHNAQKNIQQKF
jgi:trimethylamine:corrinoid methyltransferase-like protein